MATQAREARKEELYNYPVLCCRPGTRLPRTDTYTSTLLAFLNQQQDMRNHAFQHLSVKCPFGTVAPWKVFIELFINNINNPKSEDHDYKALTHKREALLPFLQLGTTKDPHWMPVEASFILSNLQAPPRDWTYLCVVWDEGAERMAMAWINHGGEWYHKVDPQTDAANDDNKILFDKDEEDEEDEVYNHQDTTRPTPATQKRTAPAHAIHPVKQPARKRPKARPTAMAKASKFTVATSQTHLDKWVRK
jgi:hypothetical protein